MIIRGPGLLAPISNLSDPVTTQYLLAISDYANPDNWVKSTGGNTNLYTMIDEGTALGAEDPADYLDTSDYAESPGAFEDIKTVSFNLTTGGVDPLTGSDHKLRFSLRSEAGSGRPVAVRLLQGGSVLGSSGFTIRDAFQWRTWNIPSGVANTITDYADLQVEVEQSALAGTWFQVRIAQVIMEFPI